MSASVRNTAMALEVSRSTSGSRPCPMPRTHRSGRPIPHRGRSRPRQMFAHRSRGRQMPPTSHLVVSKPPEPLPPPLHLPIQLGTVIVAITYTRASPVCTPIRTLTTTPPTEEKCCQPQLSRLTAAQVVIHPNCCRRDLQQAICAAEPSNAHMRRVEPEKGLEPLACSLGASSACALCSPGPRLLAAHAPASERGTVISCTSVLARALIAL